MDKDEVMIKVKEDQFVVSKQVLCEHSDYFRAMFSGNFKEQEQQEINIDIVDASSMRIITQYLKNEDAYNLKQYSLEVIGDLAEAAQTLQFTKLASFIESFLISQTITTKNIFDIWTIAHNIIGYVNLRQSCNEFGVPLLRDMELQHMPSIQELVWYLNQSHLNVVNEAEVFEFGINWLYHSNAAVDSLTFLMLLGCLDIKRATINDLLKIKNLCIPVGSLDESFATGVADCLIELNKDNAIATDKIIEQEKTIKEKYTKFVYDEVLKLVEYSRSRKTKFVPIVPVFELPTIKGRKKQTRQLHLLPYPIFDLRDENPTECQIIDPFLADAGFNLYTFTDAGLEKWLELKLPRSTHHLLYYTWDIAAWGRRNLVLVTSKCHKNCSPFDTGWFDRDSSSTTIKIYNVLKKEWIEHGSNPNLSQGIVRRVAIVGDYLYILCHIGQCIVYDLVRKSHWIIASLPFVVSDLPEASINDKRLPLTCVHNSEVYISNHRAIYKYDGNRDDWVEVMEHPERISNITSHDDGYIYVIAGHNLLRFNPGDKSMKEMQIGVDNDGSTIVNACSMGDRQLFYVNEISSTEALEAIPFIDLLTKFSRTVSVKEYSESDNAECLYKELWSLEDPGFEFDGLRSTCKLELSSPTIDGEVTEYLNQYLAKYNEQKIFSETQMKLKFERIPIKSCPQ